MLDSWPPIASLSWIHAVELLNQAFHGQRSVPFNYILGSEATSSNSITASSEGIFPYHVHARKGLFHSRPVHMQGHVSDSKVGGRGKEMEGKTSASVHNIFAVLGTRKVLYLPFWSKLRPNQNPFYKPN
ncbi:hypothetical protein OIU85_005927 [Salix viminalis]|uniref:Uncharacterized protein n=1 Tax=Salix viminalis TaxID=40686 RepID=A0A9Q0PJU4_SALVM|nr:hypothetical protein OIU85_005927 [Salix viminalis]